MEKTPQTKGGWYMQIEELIEDPVEDVPPTEEPTKEKFKDGYEFYPDASI